MLDTILIEEALKRFVAEMRTSITNYGFGDPKSREYIFLQKFQNHPVVCYPARNCFNPLEMGSDMKRKERKLAL